MENAKVLIAIPTMGYIKTDLVSRLLYWVKNFKGIAHATCGVSPVDHARNEIVRNFLKTDCTHLFFVDSDTVPPVEALEELLKMNVDVASAITHIYRDGGIINNCFTDYTSNEFGTTMTAVIEHTGIQEVVRCGGSCLLIKREVLEKVEIPWFLNEWNEKFTGYVSEDLYFCDKAVKAGFKIFCNTDIVCEHSKELMI